MTGAVAQTTHPRAARRLQDRLAAGFLLALMALGCAVMWIGAPASGLWLAGELTESRATHLLIALPAVLGAIVLCASGLSRLNRLYLRVTLGPSMGLDDEDVDEEERRRMRGPLEPMLVGSLVIAVVAFFVWFLF